MAVDRPIEPEKDAEEGRKSATKFKRWFEDSYKAFESFRTKMIESYKFVSGDQWSEADKQWLLGKKRPMVVINKVLSPVLFLEGLQRQQRAEPKFLPFESGDVKASEIMQALYKWVGVQCREDVVDTHVFRDKSVAGLGFWKIYMSIENDPEGEIIWERVSPLSIFPDPVFLDEGWKAAQYCIQATWFTLDDAVATWPEHEDAIRRQYGEWLEHGHSKNTTFGGGEMAGDSLASFRSFWDKETQRARVLEIWYKVRVSVPMILVPDGEPIAGDEEVQQALMEAEMAGLPPPNVIRRPVTQIRVAHLLDETVLDDEESPYTKEPCFPIFPTVGFYYWSEPFGVVEPMKDPQREKNRRRSTMIEMVRRSALSGFKNNRNSGAKSEDLEKYATGEGAIINYESVAPEEIRPPELPQTLVFLDARSDAEINAVVNVHNEMLGNSSQKTVSGRAIEARQRSGLTVQEPLLESFQQDKEYATRFAVGLIQQFMSVPKAMRILGAIAVRRPNDPAAQIAANPQMEVAQILERSLAAKFDVVISSKPWEPSVNQQILETLTEMAEKFPIPPEVLIDAAKTAGRLTEEHATKMLAHIQQQQAMQQPAPGGPPPPQLQ